MTEPISIYVCFEPERQAYAERLDTWPWTNEDLDSYNRRFSVAVDSREAEEIKVCLRRQIEQADVTVCVIGASTCSDPWIAWELETSKSGREGSGPDPKGTRASNGTGAPNGMGAPSGARAPNGLVGVTLHKFDEHPPAMVDCGAIFVAFQRDLVERAVRWALTEKYTSDDFTLRDF